MILENLEHIVLITGTIVNCYIAFEIFKLNKKESNPKLIITANQKEVGDFFDAETIFNKELNSINFEQEGFPEILDEEKIWLVKIQNRGDFPAKKVHIKLRLVLKIAVPIYDTKGEILEIKIEPYKEFIYEFNRDYFAPEITVKIRLVSIDGRFIEADLYMEEAYSKQVKFIKESVLLDTYIHSGLDNMADEIDYKKIHGLCNKGLK